MNSNQNPCCGQMEESVSVLKVALYHPDHNCGIFQGIPDQIKCTMDNLYIGRGPQCNVTLKHQQVSRCHLQLEPYMRKQVPYLQFSLKNLSNKHSVTVNGLQLQYLQQITLTSSNRIIFCGIQMVIELDFGMSTANFLCCFTFSESPLIQNYKPEESDEHETIAVHQQLTKNQIANTF
ncbi:TRAF-interacting protein with FHA domain-containing protein B [Protopterus annectens]|uniref:TRAF-interacting protein with FHA domain-containing protein B n=1 Tax=Protopterus annectens TaxID=7888 RepID=UPI001CFBD792|nr:TRAF-interacting protein with FHA domain-containing protein B [Protopterus annectens]